MQLSTMVGYNLFWLFFIVFFIFLVILCFVPCFQERPTSNVVTERPVILVEAPVVSGEIPSAPYEATIARSSQNREIPVATPF